VRRFLGLVGVGIALLRPAWLPAQAPATLGGRITDTDGVPIAAAAVRLSGVGPDRVV
jgi:hypothetical protein